MDLTLRMAGGAPGVKACGNSGVAGTGSCTVLVEKYVVIVPMLEELVALLLVPLRHVYEEDHVDVEDHGTGALERCWLAPELGGLAAAIGGDLLLQ
jgi:hypothetical protein